MATNPLRIAVLISGGGTTLKNLLDRVNAGTLDVDIRLVIASALGVKGLRYADEANIPAEVVERKAFDSTDAFSRQIFDLCNQAEVDVVVMAGFLKRVSIPDDYTHRVTNIHPALIPAFCGKGYYGHHVHQAVLEYGAKVSGCTVHYADNEYDHGPVILQKTVPVLDDDTPDTLADRVFQTECEAYPEALQLIAEGRIEIVGRKVRVRP